MLYSSYVEVLIANSTLKTAKNVVSKEPILHEIGRERCSHLVDLADRKRSSGLTLFVASTCESRSTRERSA